MTDLVAQFDAALAIALRDGVTLDYGRSLGLSVFRRDTRLFRCGDLVLVWFSNGQAERWHVYGRSSRGYSVSGLYVQGARFREAKRADCYSNKSPMAIVALPGECWTSGEDPSIDPATLRRWLSEAPRAGCAAGRVGASSPALPLVDYGSPPRGRRRRQNRRERARWNEEIGDVPTRASPPPGSLRDVFCSRCLARFAREENSEEYRRARCDDRVEALREPLARHAARTGCAADGGWTFGEWTEREKEST